MKRINGATSKYYGILTKIRLGGELTSIPKNLKYGTKCSGTKRKDIQLNRNGTVSVPYNLLLYRSIAASFPFNIKTPLRVKRHH